MDLKKVMIASESEAGRVQPTGVRPTRSSNSVPLSEPRICVLNIMARTYI